MRLSDVLAVIARSLTLLAGWVNSSVVCEFVSFGRSNFLDTAHFNARVRLSTNISIKRAGPRNGVRIKFSSVHHLWFAKTPADREINNIAAAISPPFCYKS
jgi:hypothetical protein